LVEIAELRREDILQPRRFPAGGVLVAAGLLQADEVGKPVRIVEGVLTHLVQELRPLFGRGRLRRNIQGLRSLWLRAAGKGWDHWFGLRRGGASKQ